jgi:hypothetical protein
MNEENIEKCSIMGDSTLYGLTGKVCSMHNIVFLLVRVLYQDIYVGVMGWWGGGVFTSSIVFDNFLLSKKLWACNLV